MTEVTNEGTFYVQKVADGPKAEALLDAFRQEFEANPPLPGAYNPKRGDLCAAKFTADDVWYRAKVEKVLFLYFDSKNQRCCLSCLLLCLSLPGLFYFID